ncbi:hypothetical protein [Agreia pratensis]|uniref:Uncharacterized protein n=1 Tax=Agreia pratensis TaxID=150121 RepID=A0A1X7IJP0_9MICO|nr:hypothetical protein [Agreia pratensis]SMG14720.1 hypothetical protein SAMN06296010_0563 [Agreia pratensis]
MSQLSQPPAFAYPNQRVVRPPLPKAQRNRVFIAGAVSNTVLTAGLSIMSLAAILFFIVASMWLIWEFLSPSLSGTYRPVDEMLAAVGLAPEQGWVAVAVLMITMVVGLAVCWAGIWIGKAMIASVGVARPWAVAWSASGILLGTGLIMSSVLSPVAGPLMTVVFSASALSGSGSGAGAESVGIVAAIAILGTLVSIVVYAAAGLLAWWWMAHALRRAE